MVAAHHKTSTSGGSPSHAERIGADAEFEPGTVGKAKDVVGGTARATPRMVGDKLPEGTLRIDQLGGKRRL